jgi:hypothetical protein
LGPVGVWQQIWWPQSFMSDQNLETTAVAVDPSDQSVYVAAGSYTNGGNSGTGIYKSTDCGATFNLVSIGTDSAEVAGGDPWVLLDDPSTPGSLYLVVGYGSKGLYKSIDQGVNWVALNADPTQTEGSAPFVQAASMLPGSSSNLVISFHNPCSNPFVELCFSQTSNGGTSWTEFNGPVLDPPSWQEAASIAFLGTDTYLYLAPTSGTASFTNNGGTSWSTVTFVDANDNPISPGFQESYAGSVYFGSDGNFYLASPTGVFVPNGQPLGTSWKMLANSPSASSLIDDGVNLYATFAWDGTGAYANGNSQVFYQAPLNQLSNWTPTPSPPLVRGGYEFAYDSAHHVVYSANFVGGLWRLVTQ